MYLGVTDYTCNSILYCFFFIVFLKVVFVKAKSADPDEMLHDAAFHLGLHCLPKYPFRGIQYAKG